MLRLLVVCAFLVAGSHGSALNSKDLQVLDDDARIVNGVDAKPGEFPTQVSLRFNGGHICGASILNANWTLTAAHCVDKLNVTRISFLSGTNDAWSRNSTVHPAAEIVIHEGYNETDSNVNDIALVRVSVPFILDGVVRSAVTLPKQGQNTAVNLTATVIGWGLLLSDGFVSRLLQKADILISDQANCRSFNAARNKTVYSSQICAYWPDGNKGACVGDSGGPLFVNGTVVGLVSWGWGKCSSRGAPTIYTRVSAYAKWIEENNASTIRMEIAAILFISQIILLRLLN